VASIFRKTGKATWWVNYYHKGKRIRHSLWTTDERAALKKLKKLEGEFVTGELESRSLTPIVPLLEEFTGHLATARTKKSYKNDISYLRIFFGPICDALKPGGTRNRRFGQGEGSAGIDRFKGRHVEVKTLEQLSANVMSNFINMRITKDGISPKTANRMREVLHVLFNYAIRQHGFRSLDRRFSNPVDAVHSLPHAGSDRQATQSLGGRSRPEGNRCRADLRRLPFSLAHIRACETAT
jgi:hypothetical protein